MILITGATGTNGVELIDQLLSLGEPVRALVRNPEKAEKLLPPDIEMTRGDLDNPGSLAAAMEDIEKVFLLCAVDPRQVDLEKNVIAAARSAGVRHIVKFSVLHAASDSPSSLLRAHFQTEQAIRASGIPFTFLRPNMFMQELLRQAESIQSQGAFYFPFDRHVRLSLVDVRDIAGVAAKVLSERGHEGKTYEITGPAALTFDEVAAAISKVIGRKVNYVPVTMEQWKQSFTAIGAPVWMVDTIAELYETFVPANSVVTDTVERVTGETGEKLCGVCERRVSLSSAQKMDNGVRSAPTWRDRVNVHAGARRRGAVVMLGGTTDAAPRIRACVIGRQKPLPRESGLHLRPAGLHGYRGSDSEFYHFDRARFKRTTRFDLPVRWN